MPVYRLVFVAENPEESIHGIRFREAVKKIAETANPGIFGLVENDFYGENANKEQVTVICKVVSREQLDFFIAKIKEKVHEIASVAITVEKQDPADNFENWINFKTFEKIEGDPLEEIGLAIRGAERLFTSLKTQIIDFSEKREKLKLQGLEYSLQRIQGSFVAGAQDKPLDRISRFGLDRFLAEPFIEDLFPVCKEIDGLFIEFYENNWERVQAVSGGKKRALLDLVEQGLGIIRAVRDTKTNTNNNKFADGGK